MNSIRTILLIISALSVCISSQSQIRVHPDNHISLGSLSKGHGLQIQPSGYAYLAPSIYVPYAWMNLTYAPNMFSKSYIVDHAGIQTFFVYGNGQIFSNGHWINSDQKFSSNIAQIDNAMSKVRQLRGVYYDPVGPKASGDTSEVTDKYGNVFRSKVRSSLPDSTNVYIDQNVRDELIDQTELRSIGLIAQEVEKVIPELVRTMPDGTKTVGYHHVICLLIEAVKEQQSEIESLKSMTGGADASLSSQPGTKREDCRLYQNTPNPFTENTTIEWKIGPGCQSVSIMILDMQGYLVKSYTDLGPSESSIIISGNDLKPGIYLYSLIVDGMEADTKKMILTQ